MKFSTVAASAVFFGMVLALPQPVEVVYETEIVTITSCAPTVTDCPYATVTPEPEHPEVEYPEEEHPAEETPCTTTDIEVPEITETPTYPNTTIPEHPEYPEEEHPEVPEYPEEEEPEHPEYPEEEHPEVPEYPEVPHYEPSGTGSIPYPVNTSTPEVPTTPPPQEGAASKVGAPLAVVIGAAALAFFA